MADNPFSDEIRRVDRDVDEWRCCMDAAMSGVWAGEAAEGWSVNAPTGFPSDAEPTQRGSPASFWEDKIKVGNWASYDAGLRRRGSLTPWVADEAIAKWPAPPRLNPGGPAHYSDMAIEIALMPRLAFHPPSRRSEGFATSIFVLLGVTVSAPDHSALSRRAATLPSLSLGRMPEGPLRVPIDGTGLKVYGAGEWLREKHGARARRSWRKLHLAVDAASGAIVARTLAEKEIADPSQVGPLLDGYKETSNRRPRTAPMMARRLTRRSRSMAPTSGS